MASAAPEPTAFSESEDRSKQRFLVELEFVQCLANPKYLAYLAQHPKKYLRDASFLAYLDYLQYWRTPAYARYIRYPECLFFLEMLQHESFRKKLADPRYVNDVWWQQEWRWWHYLPNRRGKVMPASSGDAAP